MICPVSARTALRTKKALIRSLLISLLSLGFWGFLIGRLTLGQAIFYGTEVFALCFLFFRFFPVGGGKPRRLLVLAMLLFFSATAVCAEQNRPIGASREVTPSKNLVQATKQAELRRLALIDDGILTLCVLDGYEVHYREYDNKGYCAEPAAEAKEKQ